MDGATGDACSDGDLVPDPRRVRRHGDAADQNLAGPQAAGRGRGGGVSATPASRGLKSSRAEFEGTPVFTIPLAGWASGAGLKQIARELPFDVVHAQHYGGASRAYFACRQNGWPMVYEIHSLLGDEVERDGWAEDWSSERTWRSSGGCAGTRPRSSR